MMPAFDDAKLEAMLHAFIDAYLEFVKAQLALHINSDTPYYRNAVAIALTHTAGIVATSLTSAVWSAEQAAKIDHAGNN